MKRQFVTENSVQRERLHDLVRTITDKQLQVCLPNGWPIYCALAHLAFWDQRSIVILRKWAKEGVNPSPVDPHIINDALLPFFQAIPPRIAADLAISAAHVVDTELENASDEFIASIVALGDRFRLYRSEHRKIHVDKIEEVLRKTSEKPNQAL